MRNHETREGDNENPPAITAGDSPIIEVTNDTLPNQQATQRDGIHPVGDQDDGGNMVCGNTRPGSERGHQGGKANLCLSKGQRFRIACRREVAKVKQETTATLFALHGFEPRLGCTIHLGKTKGWIIDKLEKLKDNTLQIGDQVLDEPL